MLNRQKGFTLIEIVVAFTILALGTIVSVNVITQSAVRVSKVNEYLGVINTIESAVAIVSSEIAQNRSKKNFKGAEKNGFTWQAEIVDEQSSVKGSSDRELTLYHLHVRVFNKKGRQRMALKTIVTDS